MLKPENWSLTNRSDKNILVRCCQHVNVNLWSSQFHLIAVSELCQEKTRAVQRDVSHCSAVSEAKLVINHNEVTSYAGKGSNFMSTLFHLIQFSKSDFTNLAWRWSAKAAAMSTFKKHISYNPHKQEGHSYTVQICNKWKVLLSA